MTNIKINTIDVHALKQCYDAFPDLCLIDVREIDEWQEMHIPGAIHIPKDILPGVIEQTISDKQQPIYLHCRGGVRSLTAAHSIVALGYQQVYSVDGGIMDWMHAGYPIA